MKRTKKWTVGVILAVGVVVYFASQSESDAEASTKKNNTVNKSIDLKSNPLFESIETYKTTKVEEGFNWITGRKTLISVPKNALVDGQGNQVVGAVDFQIIEYDNAFEAVLNGVDMQYDSLGVNFHFETGGMFDLKAYQNDKPVYIKEGTSVKVFKGSDHMSSKFNAYYYDEEAENWTYKGKNLQTSIESSEIQIDNPVDSVNVLKDYPLQLEFDKDDFPELEKFQQVTFYPKDIDEKTLNKLKSISWEEMKLKKSKSAYELTLMYFREKIKITVVPDIILDSLLAKKDRKLKALKRKNIVEIKYARWTEGEEGLELKVKELNFSAQVKMSRASFSQMSFDVVNVFAINNFGMWNCDSPERLPKGEEVINPTFIHKEDTIPCPSIYYLSENNKSLLFTYYVGKTFQYNKEQDNVLWFLKDEEGDMMLYYAKEKKFKFEGNYMMVNRVKILPKKYSYAKIEAILGI